ncbi:MAG: cytochrome c biogenesis protein CcsA [Alphaproteobacteria bacterium]|nr:cytochrome c biogenesis protein CcsA [Alphaproteobacteria bacterium]
MEHLLFALALAGYLAVALSRVPGFERRPGWVEPAGRVALWGGVATHLAGLVWMSVSSDQLPVYTPGASMVLLSGTIGLVTLAVQRMPRAEALSGLLAALVVVLLGLGLILPNPIRATSEGIGSLWFPIHAAMIFLGLAGFALAFGVSLLYLTVRGRLKQKRLAGLQRLPALDSLDALNTRFIVFGFLALTVGIAAGGLWAASLEGDAAMGPTVYATLVLWGWYAAAVGVRVVGGWRGRLAAHFSVVGFVGLLLGLGAIGVAFQGWH